MGNDMRVSELYVYPVLSLAGMKVRRFALDRFGPVADRRWMLVDAEGKFLTQRQKRTMSMVHAGLHEAAFGHVLTLTAPTGQTIESPVNLKRNEGDRFKVTVWDDTCDAIEESRELSHWLSGVLDVQCRLVFMPETTLRPVDQTFAQKGQTVGFADGFPLLLTTQPSLTEFCTRLGRKIDMVRFRPNLVVDGCDPFAEDKWSELRVGKIPIDVVKPCARCVIPAINPQTSEIEREITETLRLFRRSGDDLIFGQNAIHRETGEIVVGDEVTVLKGHISSSL